MRFHSTRASASRPRWFIPSASEYRRDLRALLEAKMRGEEIVAPEPVEVAPVIDLMEALKASVAASMKGGSDEKPKPARKSKPKSKARAS